MSGKQVSLERITIQARDEMFKTKDERCFSIHQCKTECRKLVMNGVSITDDDGLRTSWKNYFANLAQSQASESESNQDLDEDDIAQMEAMLHGFEDFIPDFPITVEEVESALKRLKTGRSGWGGNGLLAEHLKNGGPVLTVWLKRIFSAIIHLEQIPPSFKLGIVPIHKGKGHDPQMCNNYQGITLTSVLSKCLFLSDWNPIH